MDGQRGEALLWMLTGHTFDDYDRHMEVRKRRVGVDKIDVPGYSMDSKITQATKENLETTLKWMGMPIPEYQVYDWVTYVQGFHYPCANVTFFVGWMTGEEVMANRYRWFHEVWYGEPDRFFVPNESLHPMTSLDIESLRTDYEDFPNEAS